MKILIIGGGKVGYYLAKTLLPHGHEITMIEPNREVCARIASELNISVVNGDGTNIDQLSRAAADKAEIFIALTGRDEDNLIACQLAKRNPGIRRTIARVNNPKNIEVFNRLGVDFSVSSTTIIADLIEREVDFFGMKTLMMLKNGRIVLNEVRITSDSPACNRSLKDIKLPSGCIVISIIRSEEVIIPNGFTKLHPGDCAIVASSQSDQKELKKYLIG